MWFLFKQKPVLSTKEEYENLSQKKWIELKLGAEKLYELWTKAEYPHLKEMSCDLDYDELYVSSEFLKCNPKALECHLNHRSKNGYAEIQLDGSKLIYVKKNKKFLTKSKRGEIILNISLDKKKNYKMYFESLCHETFLPKGEYVFSPLNEGNELDNIERENSRLWKNDKNIFIDKFHITNLEYNFWKNKKKKAGLKDYFPVNDLNFLEMKEFCKERGKKLLTAKLYDAMTYSKIARIDLFADISKKTCSMIYSKDCIGKKELKFWNTNNVSWIGTYDIRGGIPEVVENQEERFFNTVSSSFYFDRSSFWHNLTHRFHWNELGFSEKDFNFVSSVTGEQLKIIEKNKIKVGFRCYREI